MPEKRPMLLLASIATLTLALNQSAPAEETPADTPATPPVTAEQQAPPVAPAVGPAAPVVEEAAATQAPSQGPSDAPTPETSDSPQAEAPVSPPPEATAMPPLPPPGDAAAGEGVEARRAEIAADRLRRYEDLRARAAEVGLDLPRTPPWEQSGIRPPELPSPPAPPVGDIPAAAPGAMSPEESEAMREQHYQAMRERAMKQGVTLPEIQPWKLMAGEERKRHWEAMRTMSPEERRALRDEHWQEMRKRAQEQGIEMPETPPWRQAEQRREEMREKWEQYRSTVEEMTPEQKEAAQAVFGTGPRTPSPPPAGWQMPMPRQFGTGAPQHPMMQGYGPQGAGPGVYPEGKANASPWPGSGQWMNPAPPVFNPAHQAW